MDEKKHNDVQSIISNTVEELFNEKKFDSKRRAFYLNSGNWLTNLNCHIRILFLNFLVTASEFVDGVLENNDSDRRCLLFIRDLDYNNDENIKKKLIENKFYDKIEIDEIDELENLNW